MNSYIDFQSKIKKLKFEWYQGLKRGVYYSFVSHLIFIIVIQILLGLNFNQSTKIRIKKIKQFAVELKQIEEPKPQVVVQGLPQKDTLEIKPEKIFFAGIEIDTTDIINRYEENTLNVSILFPDRWIFFDNRVKEIIDGVIFIPGENSNYDKRLSVLIQVNTNKNLFNPSLYDSSFTYNRAQYYISKPQKTHEQVTQVVYIRTGAFKADFVIKLTSPNENEFKKFQPVFFAMVRSFNAGYSY
ncbi:MAG: hypothetical protein NUV92_10745 [Ignavibacteria bacterium]|jgi:hypothetical protein|nr:hypothetical protein [Ignavibacteria bacterium]MDH7528549.1 hypothetical protein [Ignavibacteria bacterium]